MNTIYIAVDNLKCDGCGNTIIKHLKKLKQVSDVHIHLENSSVEITYRKPIDKDAFLDVLRKLGYPPQGTSNVLQSAKSYISCAIGRLGVA